MNPASSMEGFPFLEELVGKPYNPTICITYVINFTSYPSNLFAHINIMNGGTGIFSGRLNFSRCLSHCCMHEGSAQFACESTTK